MAETKQVLRVYRRLLKLAQHYPSIKREAIIRDIKEEFHANAIITDAQKICEAMASAHAGIKELSMYASLHPSQPNWSVEVGRDAIQSQLREGSQVKVVRDGNKAVKK
ncbi:Complex 1 LYR protein [Plasmopara halstedii]|uniref:Complex 1 LYR protein n=1 Tax=Plasmopara halstedii TaxID=4781 RepID=A0A0P1AIR9_PLAHL|nr:Complex 1 LYR protein [Plasmopara halstedii]CEG41201.1 Complex 1 LYR protein [Plasmopara halstedii]|eukprot:XP_024577570.1 Complex 1 LYR protein [Plasmopara halstedii]